MCVAAQHRQSPGGTDRAPPQDPQRAVRKNGRRETNERRGEDEFPLTILTQFSDTHTRMSSFLVISTQDQGGGGGAEKTTRSEEEGKKAEEEA